MNKIKFQQSLLLKISVMILLPTLVMLIIIGFYSYSFTRILLQDFIMENELEIAKHAMNKIDRSLHERYLDIQATAGEQSFSNYLLDYAGGTVDQNKKSDNLKRIKDLAIVTGPWNTLFVVDPNGAVILATDEGEMEKPLNRWYFENIAYEKAMKGEVNNSDFVILKHTGEPAVVFAAPVRDISNPMKPIIGETIIMAIICSTFVQFISSGPQPNKNAPTKPPIKE